MLNFKTILGIIGLCKAASCLTAVANFQCLQSGRYANLQDSTCSSYYLCSELPGGTFIKNGYKCEEGSKFDPVLEECSSSYQCRRCSVEEDNFVCSNIGRFRKPDDLSCTKYYLCTLLYENFFIKTEFTCASDSYFDDSVEECSSSYNCPCANNVSGTTEPPQTTVEYSKSFVCNEKGRFNNPVDESCSSYFLCSVLNNESLIQTERTCPLGSSFDPELHICSTLYHCAISDATTTVESGGDSTKEEFKCNTTGRFHNPEDTTCTRYFLCSLMTNGSYTQTDFVCPLGSHFDPELHLCSYYYQCVYVTPEPSTNMKTITTISVISSNCGGFQNDEFRCTVKGKFNNPRDTTCGTYFLCSSLQNGSLIQTEYNCPLGSFFDPDLQLCNERYQCACSNSPDLPSSTAISYESTTSSFAILETSTVGNLTLTTRFINSTISSSVECLAQNNAEEFICSEKGRFNNLKDESCTTYFLCNLLRNGSFIQTQYSCPSDSWFDPELQICSTFYLCPCSLTTTTPETTTSSSGSVETSPSENITLTTTSTITSTTSTSTTCFAHEEIIEAFSCSEKGRFRNPKDESCKTYFLCNLLRNGSFIQTQYSCPSDSWFDPELQICSIFYLCPCSLTTTTPETTTSSSGSVETSPSENITLTTTSTITSTTSTSTTCFAHEEIIEAFSCSEKGRFRNPKDKSCITYFLCNLLRNGSFIQTQYSCPSDSWFDPELQICSIFYLCPCSLKTTTPETATSSSGSVETSPSENITLTTTSTITSTTSTSTTCFAHEEIIEAFSCSEKGRFRNPKDESCKTYFLCNLLRNGSFIQTQYSCPSDSWFDPELQICSIFYLCPCSLKTTTPETATSSSWSVETSPSENITLTTTSTITSTTSTSTTCFAHEEIIEAFSCSEKGRFRNPKDESCKTYFLCNLLRNGSFIQTQYSCPSDSWFDPELQICSIFYLCPCSLTTTTPETATSSSGSVETSPSENITLTTTSTITSTTSTSTTCFAHEEIIEAFSCSEKGRFRHPKDESCTTYFLCNLLRNGSFIQTQYSCPSDSWFDPELQICSTFYLCPCSLTTTTTETTTSSSGSVKTSPSENTTLTTTSTITSTTSTSTACFAHEEIIEAFSCSEKGRFRNPKDESCTTYFFCNLLRNGSFIQTQYSCPSDSWFDPELQICSIFYLCPCSLTTTTPETATSSSGSVETSPSENITLTTIFTITSTTSTSTTCFAHKEIIEAFSCSEKGRFRHPKDESCTTYFFCNLLRNGSFIQTQYSCPSDSWFDPELQICSIFYLCPCSLTTTTPETTTSSSWSVETSPSENITLTTTSTITSTTSTSTTCFAHEEIIEAFSCSEKGRFRNPKDESCKTYFLCNLLRNGSFIQTQYSCPSDSWFDPELQICSIFYLCPCSLTTTTPETTTSSSGSLETSPSENITLTTTSTITSTTSTSTTCFAHEEIIEAFSCSEKGRFRHPKDESCTTYFLCNLLRNGSFIQTQYSCPSDSWFDPELQICSTFYLCPCSLTTTTTETTTSSSGSVKTSPSENTTLTTTSTITSTTSTSTACFAHEEIIEAFSCSEKGRFRNPKDESCTTYFLCNLLRNGSFIQTQYSCPSDSWFDPELQICSIFYLCPCSLTTTTPKTATSSSGSVETSPSENITLTTIFTITSTTSTSTTCFAHKEIIEAFSCSEKGRFRHPKDESCTTYFLCNLLRNGSFIQTQYSCPSDSWFDPELQICSIFYLCPCSLTTTTPETTTSSSGSVETSPSENITLTTSSTITSTTSTSTTCFAHKEIIEAFSCSEKGRFRNPKDESCTTYFLCNLLRNGSFIQTQYSCPFDSWFDPELQICSIFYVCPCLPTSITTTTTIPNVPSLSSEYSTSSTTPSECLGNNNNAVEFSCSQKGRFPNKMDTSCTSYYLCNLLRNGTFIQTKYICPDSSYFDPSIQICNIDYNCPCNVSQ